VTRSSKKAREEKAWRDQQAQQGQQQQVAAQQAQQRSLSRGRDPKGKGKGKGKRKSRSASPAKSAGKGGDRKNQLCPALKKGEQCQYGKECKFSHDRNRFDDQGRPKLTKKAIAAARAMVAAADAITPPGDGADGAGATAPEGKKPRRRRQKSNAFALAGGADDGQYEDDG